MSWTQGDLITADKLNTENGNITKRYDDGHAGWDYWTIYHYMYTTKPSGQNIANYWSDRSPGCKHNVTIHRWENGTWVQKYWEEGSGAIKDWYASVGEGAYKIVLWYHNNTPHLVLYPSKTDNIRGNYLHCLSMNPLTDNESQTTNGNGSGIYLTASALNEGRVYTD